MKNKQIEIGKIINTHGIRGEVKVLPLTDDPTRYEDLDWVYVKHEGRMEKMYIKSVRYQKNNLIIKFDGIDSIDDAQKFRDKMLLIDREMAVPLPKDTYFICDLIGMEVRTHTGEILGNINDVFKTGSNDVYVVRNTEGVRVRDILVPAIKDVIVEVNIDDNYMIIKPLEGLID
ncbi:MAG: 16S rRNA processing protein RimM [Clostridiaceae bacterium]|nr:16S rRNA processing protein RimM [Clostridiaceae bacterium]